MYSNIGLTCRETLPLSNFKCKLSQTDNYLTEKIASLLHRISTAEPICSTAGAETDHIGFTLVGCSPADANKSAETVPHAGTADWPRQPEVRRSADERRWCRPCGWLSQWGGELLSGAGEKWLGSSGSWSSGPLNQAGFFISYISLSCIRWIDALSVLFYKPCILGKFHSGSWKVG